jgi:hypothetical protein
MMTEAEFKAQMKQSTVLSQELASRAIRQSYCRWIDVAIAEGWSKSLEGLFRSAVREALRKTPQSPPPLSWFDKFPINEQDHSWLKQHGQAHFPAETEEIKAARHYLARIEPRKPFKEAAE